MSNRSGAAVEYTSVPLHVGSHIGTLLVAVTACSVLSASRNSHSYRLEVSQGFVLNWCLVVTACEL